MVIISASYKTDIPAFYGEWFRNRLHAGYCRMVNPYNPRQRRLVSLRKDDVDGFVFWTKNLAPFSDSLRDVHEQGYPFVVQYTINGYPRALESRVVDHQKAVDSFADASRRYGQRSLVWRYDTVILSTLTDAQFHRENFTNLADSLAGFTDEVVVSFLQLYKKTRRNMDIASEEHGFRWHDPTVEEKQELLASFERSASERGMRLSICAQPALMVPGVSEARCVDALRLTDVSGRPVVAQLRGTRPECGCFRSVDIGDYDTCPHGCVYCYAVMDRAKALKRYREHDPDGEFLFPQRDLPEKAREAGSNAGSFHFHPERSRRV